MRVAWCVHAWAITSTWSNPSTASAWAPSAIAISIDATRARVSLRRGASSGSNIISSAPSSSDGLERTALGHLLARAN
ncbi:MAG: hypothetical protein ACYS1B_03310 [Planctomycetota bacterium]|jgi:hypothetical protein